MAAVVVPSPRVVPTAEQPWNCEIEMRRQKTSNHSPDNLQLAGAATSCADPMLPRFGGKFVDFNQISTFTLTLFAEQVHRCSLNWATLGNPGGPFDLGSNVLLRSVAVNAAIVNNCVCVTQTI